MEKRSLANELAGTSAVVLEDQIDLLNYRRDASVCAAGDPAAAVLVSSADEIVRVVKTARGAMSQSISGGPDRRTPVAPTRLAAAS